MSLLIHIFGMLCGLGSATFAPAAVARWYGPAVTSAGFAVVVWWSGFDQILNPVWIGILVSMAAGLQLLRPGFFPLAAFTSGALAGCWISLLREQQIPMIAATTLAVGVPVVSMLLALRRPMFAPLPVYEDSVLLIAVLGLALAAAPQVAEGWQSAGVMNLDYEATRSSDAAGWVLMLSCASLAAGGCYSLWWRRR